MKRSLLSRSRTRAFGLFVAVGTSVVADVSIIATNYHGWSGAYLLQNTAAEVIVVPSLGRVMQFRLAGESDGPFWENPALLGKPMPEKPWNIPGSFGGDKTWPAPQSAWNWPPPDTFDAVPLTAQVDGQNLKLLSPISAKFGIRTERIIALAPNSARFQIITRYDKVVGDPVEVSVWVITQTQVPEAAFLPVRGKSIFPSGLSTLWENPESMITRMPGLVEFHRDSKASHKLGNDAGSIAWVGKRWSLRIDVGRDATARYPDDGCSAELYSNPDPAGYVEMETLGPLRKLSVGQSLSATNVYTLNRRQAQDAAPEARRILEWKGQ